MQAFIAAKDPGAGRRVAATIRKGVTLLMRCPEVGRIGQSPFRNVRELVVGFGSSAYVVSYRFDGTEVVILGVRYGREMER
jgi:plasmid stabilization system protein ParE